MEIDWRLYVKEGDAKIFGKGPKSLLLKIDETGSIRKAAAAMHLSYTKAWNMIENLEKGLGIQVLEKQIGGKYGGGSYLTEEAKGFIENYEAFEQEAGEAIAKIFQSRFGS